MSEIKLLPCPFCGGEAEIVSSCFFGWDKQIICKKCGASTRYLCGVTPSQAIKNAVKKWNTRKPMERIIEKLEEERKQYSRRSEEWRKQKVWLEEQRHYSKACSYNHAIDIVKEEGGIE